MRINKPQCLEERLASLGLWQHSEKHRFNLSEFARAGFFFEHSFDIHDDPGRLRCAYCPAVIGNWQSEDDPWTEHALSVDHCPHVTRHKGEEFVERVKKEENELSRIADYLGDIINPDETNCELQFEQTSIDLFGIPTTAMRSEQKVSSNMNCGQPLGGTGGNPCHQHRYDGTGKRTRQKQSVSDRNMDSKEARLTSFDHVRHLIENDGLLNQIAESGFYFEGINEGGIKVRCYSCGCALYDISDDDDLWSVHAQMANCEHVMTRKGQDFILQAHATDTGCNQEAIPLSEYQTKKWKLCEITVNSYETGISKKPRTQRSVPINGHRTEQSCTQRSEQRREPDTKKRHAHRSVQTEENDSKRQFTRRPEPSKESESKKLCTNQSVSCKKHDNKKLCTQHNKHDAKTLSTQRSVPNKKHDVKKLCTQRSTPNKEHSCKNASGCKRRPRFYCYNGRWCLIKWRPLVTCRPSCGQHDNDLGPGLSGGDIHRGPNANGIVFLCCHLKLYRRNGGEGPCPNCLQDKHVRSC
ncbi:uncharacterized protein LOC123550980 [Mercenaria mercenaria]|uniref:uncharacterized protein LOC123550980 n=1 Tax=Mercenaria mercenaria TaxID=6596 RepID=UPI00234F8AA3|nr:uncharacterized protein LOC123550980 [Mercenaria mercenaria]XP_053396398.1 uncharacterized protein LOC123550980 [Mercenaria mercenaria]XP_053396399.1 uncharacterized protein LOC123550980 [Mercenaria mercenaria]XP_053396400.1 uncharacterized protein LOC123550980 [Mercenaria mercenaria]